MLKVNYHQTEENKKDKNTYGKQNAFITNRINIPVPRKMFFISPNSMVAIFINIYINIYIQIFAYCFDDYCYRHYVGETVQKTFEMERLVCANCLCFGVFN